MVRVVQVTRLVMLDITHMCRRPVSLLDTDIVSRWVAPMCRCPVSPPPHPGCGGLCRQSPGPRARPPSTRTWRRAWRGSRQPSLSPRRTSPPASPGQLPRSSAGSWPGHWSSCYNALLQERDEAAGEWGHLLQRCEDDCAQPGAAQLGGPFGDREKGWLLTLLTVTDISTLARCGVPSWCWSSPRVPGSSSVSCWSPR